MSRQGRLSALERAFSIPQRKAPLLALAVELRRADGWVQVCRMAAEEEPGWLEDRVETADPLVAAIGHCGDFERDVRTARAVCALGLSLCGRLDESAALKQAAGLFGEEPPADFSRLDPIAQPQLAELVAALRNDPVSRSRRVSTVVADVDGVARLGSVRVSIHPERTPGLRLDVSPRLFSPPDPELEAAMPVVEGQLGRSLPALRVRVEAENANGGGGDACAAAIAAAADAVVHGRRLGDEKAIVGALGDEGALIPSRRPRWADVKRVLDETKPAVVLAAGAGGIKNLHTLRRALYAPARRRRLLVAAAASAVLAAVAAALIVPSLGADPNAESAARQAMQLLPSSPLHAAMRAARAISLQEDGLSREAGARVLAAAPLTEATGQEDGHLLAVAISDSRVTTVSTRGRVTGWRLRGKSLRPFTAVEFPRGSTFVALSQSGRWLLVRPPESYERTLLVDTTGHHADRYLIAPEDAISAVADGNRPVVAMATSDGLELSDGGPAPAVDGEIEALAFSPSGRLLAVAASGQTAVFQRRSGAWSLWRAWRREVPPVASVEIKRVEVDDRGNTLISIDGLGSAVRWGSRRRLGEYEMTEGFGALAGRSFYLLPSDHQLQLMQETSAGPVQATSFPAPAADAAERAVAASPAGDRAVVAGPDGLFWVLDLRRVRVPGGDVVTDSPAVHDRQLTILEEAPGGSRLASWDLGSLEPPHHGPVVPGDPRVAVTTADGELVACTTDRETIVIRRTLDGSPVGSLRGRGGESWSNIAADRAGTVLAAVDEHRDSVSVWKLQRRRSGRVIGRIVYRGPAFHRPEPDFPDPLAISPDGRLLVYGTADELMLRDLRSGRVSHLPEVPGDVIRARFGTAGKRILLSTSQGVTELFGPHWSESHHLSDVEAHDATSLGSGYTAVVNGFGVQLLVGHDPAPLYQGVGADGVGAGTLSVSSDGETAIPNFDRLPLVVLRNTKPTQKTICALAGGRSPAAGGCGPRPALPEARPASGTAEDSERDVTLSASGLGDLRFEKPLPSEIARLPAYKWEGCAIRTLPGRGAAVISDHDLVESILLFQPSYISDGSQTREGVEVATDRGLIPSSTYPARAIYGRPDEKRGSRSMWRLVRADGGHGVLTVGISYSSTTPITMSVENPRCEGWE